MFATIRKGLTDKEERDLNELHNSQGWQGVFGASFAQLLKGNEAKADEWADTTAKDLRMVKFAMTALDQMAKQAFDQMAAGMGQGIAHAIVYSQSVGAAMEAALKSTLASLAGQAYTQAIYAMATGFLDLAIGNDAAAASAFEAAALFAVVGTAAAFVGRAIPGGSGASAAGGGASSGPGMSSQTSAQQQNAQAGAVGAPGGGGGPHVTVNVQGHLVGWTNMGEFASAMNDAVMNSGVTLTATNTTTGKQVQQ